MPSPSLNFRLPQAMLDWVSQEAKRLDRTPGWIARKGILNLMSDEAVREMDNKPKPERSSANPNPRRQ